MGKTKPTAKPAAEQAEKPHTPAPSLHLHWLQTKFSLLELAFAGAVDLWELDRDAAEPFLSLFEDMGHDLHDLEEDIKTLEQPAATGGER